MLSFVDLSVVMLRTIAPVAFMLSAIMLLVVILSNAKPTVITLSLACLVS